MVPGAEPVFRQVCEPSADWGFVPGCFALCRCGVRDPPSGECERVRHIGRALERRFVVDRSEPQCRRCQIWELTSSDFLPSTTNFMAVGYSYGANAELMLAERWNGSEWLIVPTADPS